MRRLAILAGFLAGTFWSTLPALAESAPMAVDDFVSSDGKTVQIYVLANDRGDLDPSTLSIASEPAQGEATVIATGSPRVKFSGSGQGADTFQYSVCNASGTCATATVTVNFAIITTTSTTSTTVVETTTTSTTQSTATTILASPEPAPTTASLPTLSTLPSETTVATAAPPDPLITLAMSEHDEAAGTTVGEPRSLHLAEDVRFLGRSGAETLKLVAVPAVMVSGIVGFLLVGLPQNALSSLLGFLVAARCREKDEKKRP